MDIFSHGLWVAATYKGTNDFVLKPKSKKPLKVWWATFWGFFLFKKLTNSNRIN